MSADEMCGDCPAPCNCDDPETHDGAVTAAGCPSVTDNARAEAWDEGARATAHAAEYLGTYPPNPYRAAGRAEMTTATDEDALRSLRAWVSDHASEAIDRQALKREIDRRITTLATARTRPTREHIAERLRQRAIDDEAHADRLDTDDGPSADEWDRWYDEHLTVSHWIDGEALRVEGAPEAIADAVLALLNEEAGR